MVRAPSIPTVKALFAVSGNVCAFPECDRPLVDQSSNVVIGEVCHIEAASPGGPRYGSQQSEDERQGFANLVLMCASHHKIIDERVSDFPVERLREIKKRHETKHQRTVSTLNDVSAQNLIRNSVVLGSVVQTVNQSGGQAAHVIVNPPMQVKEPELIPRIHSFNPNPGQLHAFCLHIENQGDATADQIQIQVEHKMKWPCLAFRAVVFGRWDRPTGPTLFGRREASIPIVTSGCFKSNSNRIRMNSFLVFGFGREITCLLNTRSPSRVMKVKEGCGRMGQRWVERMRRQ